MTYEIVDRESGNTVAAFESEGEASDYLAHVIEKDPGERTVLALVGLDESGQAVKSWTADEVIPA